MKLGGVGRFAVGLIAGAALAIATGCASYAGWGATPPVTAPSATAGHGRPSIRRDDRDCGAFTKRETDSCRHGSGCRTARSLRFLRPSRWACPDGKVYTSFDLARARTREYELPPLPPPAPIVLTAYPEQPSAPVEKMVLRGVHFDFNKADIRAQDAAVLDEAAETLKTHPDVAVAANGYCDSIGGVSIQPEALSTSGRCRRALPRRPRRSGKPSEPAWFWQDGLRRQ